eukprot:gnl/TRDRNA2_/TRDRNA2_167189_c0_seq2.p1 gnl/TRDRNA2_/TRDRNA2_167189_c0~~gnl/TRDRNA2_/TRDRNA2_167189_c0_seq2.p1  ORF type:complete len:327 (+),score=53.22 gnl/TRDRNA2_/TRDRNA2_167189_c0_seq2:100-981(+)
MAAAARRTNSRGRAAPAAEMRTIGRGSGRCGQASLLFILLAGGPLLVWGQGNMPTPKPLTQWELARNYTTPCGYGNFSNNTCTCPWQYKTCCGKLLRAEAKLACREFASRGANDVQCRFWEDNAEEQCNTWCANCTTIAEAIYDQCVFLLQKVMSNWKQIGKHCGAARDTFRVSRCPSVCDKNIELCNSPQWEMCNAKCGNFKDCHCMQTRGTWGGPDICEGKTVLQGPQPGRIGEDWNCKRSVPFHCKNHWENTACGHYKHCPADLCVVKNTTCPLSSWLGSPWALSVYTEG